MSTVGGLLDPVTDLQLIRLSLHETNTHTYLTHTSFHTASPTPPFPSTHTLYVPHLHFPWSTTLSDILHATLRLRLHPIHTTPPHTLPDTPHLFYPALPPPEQSANAHTLAVIHATHPNILPRIAVFVKLAYCNNLLHSLNRLLTSTTASLSRTAPPKHPHTKAIPTHPRPGAAESGCVIPAPSAKPLPNLPPPPQTRPSATLRIAAHSLPTHRTAPSAFLLHGVSIPAPLLPTAITILRAYSILVETYTPHPPATLLNLSNRAHRRPLSGRGPPIVDDPVHKFVLRVYGMPWPAFCAALVRQARVIVDTQRRADLRALLKSLEKAVEECGALRTSLVDDAIAKEVAGSSLARMCAFAIAKSDRGEFESDFGRFGSECVRHVGEARHRIWQLSAEETRSAAVLVAGMKTGAR